MQEIELPATVLGAALNDPPLVSLAGGRHRGWRLAGLTSRMLVGTVLTLPLTWPAVDVDVDWTCLRGGKGHVVWRAVHVFLTPGDSLEHGFTEAPTVRAATAGVHVLARTEGVVRGLANQPGRQLHLRVGRDPSDPGDDYRRPLALLGIRLREATP